MHTVHHTESFILKKEPMGEANVRVWLFTRDFGLVVATVQGVRKHGAKLQMQLSEYALVSVDLVKGRDVWRLVSVTEINNPFIGKNTNGLGRAFARTLSAVERFCHGEEANEILFSHLRECIECLTQKDIDTLSFDTVSIWKVLGALGYVSVKDIEKELFLMPFVEAVRSIDGKTRMLLIKEINKIIKETHL